MKKTYQHFKKSSFLSAENLSYLEQNHSVYSSMIEGQGNESVVLKDDVIQSFKADMSASVGAVNQSDNTDMILAKVGYRFANLNPLREQLDKHEIIKGIQDLGYAINNLSEEDLAIYCGTMAIDAEHIANENVKKWLYAEFKQGITFNQEEKFSILKDLVSADEFEKYLDLKFVGQKRFSVEGNDALIPCVNYIINNLPVYDYKSITMGMAHRGRLNVLLNVCGMKSKTLLDMFSGQSKSIGFTSGDVKYHLGFESVKDVDGVEIPISLASNPSHLEFITPVVMGEVRAKQKKSNDKNHLSLTVHGDAAFSGQGTVMESIAMSNVPANTIGGTIHIVLDNQIGFTNDKVEDMRSSYGPADIAKMVDAPILYANANDPEACVFVCNIALKYLVKYRKSIFVVILGYRRHGHNEGDEPSMTSPERYKFLAKHPVSAQIYADKLVAQNILSNDEYIHLRKSYRALLDEGKSVLSNIREVEKKQLYLKDEDWRSAYHVDISKSDLIAFTKHIATLPDGFDVHKSVMRLLNQRMAMANEERPLDWGMAEMLAYAVLLSHGHSVRLNGQDAQRGTFSHRHVVVSKLDNDDKEYNVLSSVCASNASFDVFNSILSEQGILGFEYGYAVAAKDELVLWEAQFGDFANGAQVIIDQFIASSMQKWLETSKLVMLLPHGYEGMGPEHTSGRLERFLQLSAQKNIQVCVPTTPAQIYHLLLRQYHRPFTRPLIVMTPKSLLRHQAAISTYDELISGQFENVIENTRNNEQSEKVILCTGKVYYDLLEYQVKHNLNVPLIRVEQLYPLPDIELKTILEKYIQCEKFIWCQEEPMNQGAWFVLRSRMNACLPKQKQLTYVGRDATASPAVGYYNRHLEEQVKLVEDAFNV